MCLSSSFFLPFLHAFPLLDGTVVVERLFESGACRGGLGEEGREGGREGKEGGCGKVRR